jgi:hypothetical protein
MSRPTGKPLVWLHGAVRTPPLSASARIEAGVLLRKLQRGDSLGMPRSRLMPAIGKRCHELRIVVVDVFRKKTRATPKAVLDTCADRLRRYDAIAGEKE